MNDPRGVIAGRYVLFGELASGGMATVHVGRQLGAGGFARTVAIKRLHERFARDAEFVAMFLDEARLVARVRHPNVVQTLDVVTTETELFLVMDYVPGESLLRLMRQADRAGRPIPVPIVRAVLVGVLSGLHAAHEARSETGEPLGIVHRDVSPHNVLVGIDGVARVLDFGIAKAQERVHTTRDGDIKGKLSYMTSEQIRGASVDRRADVYAAAIVGWEMLAGKKLFDGETQAATMHAAMYQEIPPPSRLRPDVDGGLEAALLRGLSRDASTRWSTAAEMASALERTGPTASTSDVRAWVEELAQGSLAQRAALVAAMETRTPSGKLAQADIERAVSSRSLSHLSMPVSAPLGSNAPPASPASAPSPSAAPAPAMTAPPPPHGTGSVSGARPPARAGAAPLFAIAGLVLVALVVGAGGLAAWKLRGVGPSATTISSRMVATAAPSDAASASAAPVGAAGASAASASAAGGCPEGMVAVPGGRFFMGSDDDLPDEKPAHNVTLAPLCLDRHEVTADAYKACSDRGECKRAPQANKYPGMTPAEAKLYDPLCNGGVEGRGQHPINCVDWEMADRFCRAAGKRLPTEAEWEFAARGSDGRKYPWGDAPPTGKHLNACGAECLAWAKKSGVELLAMYPESDGWVATAPVGSFPEGRSRFGADDLVGNVWEWTADWHGAYGKADEVDPKGPAKGAERVIRGGAWNGSYADWVRPTFRYHAAPDARSHGVGFRCAK